jgi:hypothetical protein
MEAVCRGVPLADVIEKENPVTDLMHDLDPAKTVECKTDFCLKPAPRYGRYAGRCEEHRLVEAEAEAAPEPGEYGYEEPGAVEPTVLMQALLAIEVAIEARRLADEAVAARIEELQDLLGEISIDSRLREEVG